MHGRDEGSSVLENPHAGQGPVVLDIGGDIGALIVSHPAAMEGVEIEIRPQRGAPHRQGHAYEHRAHVAVVGRPVAGTVHYTAVFPQLRSGAYELYERPNGAVQLTVTVSGGCVSHEQWPSPD